MNAWYAGAVTFLAGLAGYGFIFLVLLERMFPTLPDVILSVSTALLGAGLLLMLGGAATYLLEAYGIRPQD